MEWLQNGLPKEAENISSAVGMQNKLTRFVSFHATFSAVLPPLTKYPTMPAVTNQAAVAIR